MRIFIRKHAPIVLAQLVFLCLSLSGGAPDAEAAPAVSGHIRLMRGQVFIMDAQSKIVADAAGKRGRSTQPNSPFYQGETVITKEDGRVKLEFVEGGNEVVLGPNTVLTIERSSTSAAAKPGTKLNLARGEVRSNVKVKYSGEGENVYEVRTPNAVAGVRGTIFLARFNAQTFKSDVATERGAVAVRGAMGAITMVRAGMFTSVASSSLAVAPKPISSNPEINKAVQKLAGTSEKGFKDDDTPVKSDSSKSGNRGNASVPGEKSDNQKTAVPAPLSREESAPANQSAPAEGSSSVGPRDGSAKNEGAGNRQVASESAPTSGPGPSSGGVITGGGTVGAAGTGFGGGAFGGTAGGFAPGTGGLGALDQLNNATNKQKQIQQAPASNMGRVKVIIR